MWWDDADDTPFSLRRQIGVPGEANPSRAHEKAALQAEREEQIAEANARRAAAEARVEAAKK